MHANRLSLLPRLAGYGVLAFVAWLLFSTLFMPLMSSSATRAILNAPAILLTTPIDGVVRTLNIQPGTTFTTGQDIATIENPRAEQETLLGLQTRRLTLQQQLAATASQAEHDRKYYNALEITSQQYQDAYEVRKRYAQKALKAESGAAGARLADARETLARNLELFRQGAVSEALVASSKARLASLQADAETIRSRVHINDGDLSAAKDQVYLDPEQLRMFDLKSQMTTLKLSMDNLERNRITLEEELSRLDQLIESEQSRVKMMAAYNVVAYSSGTVQELIAPQGTQVRAGSTLLRATNCSQSYVVAVFPERMASRIDRDSELNVSIRGVAQPLKAKVVQLLSSPTDVQSSSYSVPFPYAEQNSVYVVGRFDNNLPPAERLLTCNPGNWVTATVSR